jgi:hypothetical protein
VFAPFLIILLLSFFLLPKVYPTHFSATTERKSMKLHRNVDSYKVSWSLMKGIQKFVKSPLFCFHGNCGKVCLTDSVSTAHWPSVIFRFHRFVAARYYVLQMKFERHIVLCFCFVFLRLVYPMLDCPIVIVPSMFSSVYV